MLILLLRGSTLRFESGLLCADAGPPTPIRPESTAANTAIHMILIVDLAMCKPPSEVELTGGCFLMSCLASKSNNPDVTDPYSLPLLMIKRKDSVEVICDLNEVIHALN